MKTYENQSEMQLGDIVRAAPLTDAQQGQGGLLIPRLLRRQKT